MHIVVPDDFPPTYGSLDQPDLRRLQDYGTSVALHTTRAADRAELFERLREAEAIINVRAYTLLDDEAMSMAPKLRMISILGTGTDNVDLAAAKRRDIVVTNTPGTGATSVAELTLGLLLAVARAVPVSDARLRRGEWQHVEGPELEGGMGWACACLPGLGAKTQNARRGWV